MFTVSLAVEHHQKAVGHHEKTAEHYEADNHEKADHYAHTAAGHKERAAHASGDK